MRLEMTFLYGQPPISQNFVNVLQSFWQSFGKVYGKVWKSYAKFAKEIQTWLAKKYKVLQRNTKESIFATLSRGHCPGKVGQLKDLLLGLKLPKFLLHEYGYSKDMIFGDSLECYTWLGWINVSWKCICKTYSDVV